MSVALVKRSAENLRFDVDVSTLLSAGERINDAPTVAVDESTTPPLTIGTIVVNDSPITYPDHVAPIGTVVQIQVGGGTVIDVGGVQRYTLRVRFHTNLGSNYVEATVAVAVNDAPL